MLQIIKMTDYLSIRYFTECKAFACWVSIVRLLCSEWAFVWYFNDLSSPPKSKDTLHSLLFSYNESLGNGKILPVNSEWVNECKSFLLFTVVLPASSPSAESTCSSTQTRHCSAVCKVTNCWQINTRERIKLLLIQINSASKEALDGPVSAKMITYCMLKHVFILIFNKAVSLSLLTAI